MVKFDIDWDVFLKEEFQKEYYVNLREFLKTEYKYKKIYPAMNDIFNAYKYTAYSHVKAVILGQDPYHGQEQAHGLAFSVRDNIAKPPSLINIFKELSTDLDIPVADSGCLIPWAENGVLLLNTVLTVQSGSAGSHRKKGWEVLTDNTISFLNKRAEPIVFILWGNFAKSKIELITNPVHLILTAPHPSPLSAYYGFFGCRHFSKTNEFLVNNGIEPISWELKRCKN